MPHELPAPMGKGYSSPVKKKRDTLDEIAAYAAQQPQEPIAEQEPLPGTGY
jgi:hypothetical protein